MSTSETVDVNDNEGLKSTAAEDGTSQEKSKTENKLSEKDVDRILTDYFRQLFEEFAEKCGILNLEIKINHSLFKDLFQFTWGPDIFKAARSELQRIYDELSYSFAVTEKQSDLNDMLMYQPTEVIFSKFAQVVFAIALVEPNLALRNLMELQDILEAQKSRLDCDAQKAYEFLLETLINLLEVLTGWEIDRKTQAMDNQNQTNELDEKLTYKDLRVQSQSVITGLRALFMRLFRIRSRERFILLQQVHNSLPANVEWVLYLAKSLRMKRRDQPTSNYDKKPTPKELEYVDLTLTMEPDNPFVRLNLIECVIDAVREFNGRFKCGDKINLVDLETAMKFLQKECKLLCDDFPKNVNFKSVVSDFFTRYVPYIYFDKDFSGKLLTEAFELNPSNPKTAHRLAIFHRMSMKNVTESLRWLEKTMELDPSHVTGNLDYFKLLIGKPKDNPELGIKMESILNGPNSACWRHLERIEFMFYVGLAYFAGGDKEEALRCWMETLPHCETFFTLTKVDEDCNYFKWDTKYISSDKIRMWIQTEYETMRGLGATNGVYSDQRKKCVSRIFRLMLGLLNPLRPNYVEGPYCENFSLALPPHVQKMLVPALEAIRK